jgi:hypothetical protein
MGEAEDVVVVPADAHSGSPVYHEEAKVARKVSGSKLPSSHL